MTSESIRAKEFRRETDSSLTALESDFMISTMETTSFEMAELSIQAIGPYFCIQTKREILILKKKFGKYLFIDTISQTVHRNCMRLFADGMIGSYND